MSLLPHQWGKSDALVLVRLLCLIVLVSHSVIAIVVACFYRLRMVRTYLRKTTRASYGEDLLTSVMHKVARGELSKNQAFRQYGIPRSTLAKRMKNISHRPSGLGRFKRVFDEAHEDELCEHAIAMQRRFYGLSLRDLRSLAFQVAEINKFEHPFSKNDRMAGKDWALGFVKRRSELSLRSPEATSLARAVGFNRLQVGKFFTLLNQELGKHKVSQIFNVDESGITTVQKPGKVLAEVGCKQVGRMVSQEKGATTTVVCAMSPSGVYVPPMMLFKRKNMNKNLMKGATPGAVGVPSPTGWMDTTIFVKYLKHFICHVRPSKSNPCLVILDGHASHKSLEAITLAKDNSITLLTIPPHTSHKLQPLDVSFFGPLKTRYNRELDKWMVTNPGKRITDYEIAELFAHAYEATASLDKAKNGFQKTGIFPYNPDVFTEEDFRPSQVTEQAQTSIDDANNDMSIEIDVAVSVPAQNTPEESETATQADPQVSVSDVANQDASNGVSSLSCTPEPKKKGGKKARPTSTQNTSEESETAAQADPQASVSGVASQDASKGVSSLSRKPKPKKKGGKNAYTSKVYRPPKPVHLRPEGPRLPKWHRKYTSTSSALLPESPSELNLQLQHEQNKGM